ncbi:MAG: TetR/AcrR family transcriptional regulator [Verrucomicrobiae bacterium]|nr:TetR/AcrR family transcriptional regulator [Verrucomicrobiae bacterium]
MRPTYVGLDAAERLLAERGVDAVSFRDITAAAGANLEAINYHFSSKDRLPEAVFERGLGPSAAARLDPIEALRHNNSAGRTAPSAVFYAPNAIACRPAPCIC